VAKHSAGSSIDFIDRPETRTATKYCAPENYSIGATDARMQSRLTDALRQESWIAADFVGIAVMGGVVHLFGEADSMHAALTLRRIAAATPEAVAIIDDLWVACE
jgi:osmotically-inducible protein OsmY